MGRRRYGSLAEGESWETLIATNSPLLEFFLAESSTFDSQSIGFAYDTSLDERDLKFTYTTAGGLELPGSVRYVSSNGGGMSGVPEPAAGRAFVIGFLICFVASRSYDPQRFCLPEELQ